jgi:integrase
MSYLKKRGNKYSYSRRIPTKLRKYYPENKERVVIALDTDSLKVAEQKSIKINQDVENYWKQLSTTGNEYSKEGFSSVLETAKLYGLTYKSVDELAQDSTNELINRLLLVQESSNNPDLVKAKLGGAEIPSLPLSEALEVYWAITSNLVMGKSENQIRKWRNPRIKAMNNLIKLIGDKSLKKLVRDDIIALRDWWIERIQHENVKSSSANKDFIHVKNIILTVSEHKNLGLNSDWLFNKITLRENKKAKRPPFETGFIQQKLLNPVYHTELNDQAKYILYILAETGARPNEIVGLRAEDIILDDSIPHIKIRPYERRTLKTTDSERDIPLVGCALWALKQMPEGFPRYRDNKAGTENLSGTLMKHLKAKELLPSKDHVLYSLRHSFQDRLTNLGVPDRIQCQLMGHHFKDRIEYGQGATLEKKQEWLLKMCFTPPSL